MNDESERHCTLEEMCLILKPVYSSILNNSDIIRWKEELPPNYATTDRLHPIINQFRELKSGFIETCKIN